jgi:hypothetical protein
MTPVFLDTVGLIAIWNAADQWHDVAEAADDFLKRRDICLYDFFCTARMRECSIKKAVSSARNPIEGTVAA